MFRSERRRSAPPIPTARDGPSLVVGAWPSSCTYSSSKATRKLKIELHGAQLPGRPMDVPAASRQSSGREDRFAGHVTCKDVQCASASDQCALGVVPPSAVRRNVRDVRIARGKLHFRIMIRSPNGFSARPERNPCSLRFPLQAGCASQKMWRVVLREAPHAQKSMEHARSLVTIHSSQLGQPERQLAIAAQARLVNQKWPGQFIGFNW